MPHKKDDLVAIERYKVLELADKLGNVAEACRKMKIDRSRYYLWKKRFEAKGLEGLKPHSRKPKKHPHATKDNVKRLIINTSLTHPSLGCNKIAHLVIGQGHTISAQTIQRILRKRKLGTRNERALYLYESVQGDLEKLTKEQLLFIKPYFPES